MYIRWLGFVSRQHHMGDMLAYELGLEASGSRKEVCAEPIRDLRSMSDLATRCWFVGLLVKEDAVTKEFCADVWSERNKQGALQAYKKSRGDRRSNIAHSEAFVLPRYDGIVVTAHAWAESKTRKAVLWASKQYNIPVYRINQQLELTKIAG